MKKKINLIAIFLIVIAIITGCALNNKSETPQNEKKNQEKTEVKGEDAPKQHIPLAKIGEQLGLFHDVDAIAFLAEGYAFHLPLIQPEESDSVYNRTEYKPFKVKYNGEFLKEDPQGRFVLSEPLQGLQKLDIVYEDGTEKEITVNFVRSFDFAIHADSSKLFESPTMQGMFSYYRIPRIILSKGFENQQNAWNVILNEAVAEPLTLVKSMEDTGSSEYISTLDYELSSDGKVLSIIFVKSQGMSGFVDDTKSVFVRNLQLTDLAPLKNEELLKIYDISTEVLNTKIDEFITKNPEIKMGDKNIKLEKISLEKIEDLNIFIKNKGLYINLPYSIENENGGYIPIRIMDVK